MRILTFSDIHFKKPYEDKKFVKEYFDAFKNSLADIHEESPIDIAVIGGDLAFSGETDQYIAFKNLIKTSIPADVPVYSIVGNHEVNWSFLKDAIGNDQPLSKLFDFTENEINKNSKFHKIFSNYYASFQEHMNKEIPASEMIYKFCPKTFTGYLHSDADNILILFLNSAWFSFGPGVIEDYFKNWAKEKDREALINEVPKLLGDTLSQEGKQSYFLNTYPYFEEVNKLILANENIRVLSFAHHPPSWLRWNELYDEDDTTRNFNTLINFSDILVTGHLHSPVVEPTLIKNKCYHINNGIFLDYHFVDNDAGKDNPISIFPNNWFNIIDVYTDAFELSSYKFHSKQISGKGRQYSKEWVKSNKGSSVFDFKEYNISVAPDADTSQTSKSIKQSTLKQFTPPTVKFLTECIEKQRNNIFKNPNPAQRKLNPEEVLHLTLNGEIYLILINQLDSLYAVIERSENEDDLKQNPLFKSLLHQLDVSDKNNLPIIAFYDVVDGVDKKYPLAFESYQQDRFMLFQAFKHNFFVKFKALYKFTELNMVYDIFFT